MLSSVMKSDICIARVPVVNSKNFTFAGHYQLISMKLIPVIADNWRMDGGVAFGVVPKIIWSRTYKPDENNMIPITTRCLLVISENHKILIDAGLGNKRNEKYYEVRYRENGADVLKSLSDNGVSADEITDVIFTHLHDDHVGGATSLDTDKKPICVFRNARYNITETQWQWALNPNKREGAAFFRDNLLPLQESGRLNLLKPGEQPFENIELRVFNGHTRGQIIPLIHTGKQTVVFMGDFIPTMANIPLPYIPSVDIEPLISLAEKEQFLDEAAGMHYVLFFEHDAVNECCTVIKTEKGVVPKLSFKLQDIDF